jgi:UDP-N-acetylglucosamine diphosphorylase/glucosamine-1-phosphate N-acetyltransferase
MILLIDDRQARTFEPFASSRPLSEVRAGALLIRERWAQLLDVPATAFLSSPHLWGFAEFDAPPFLAAPTSTALWAVNTRALPLLTQRVSASTRVLTIDGEVAAVRLDGGVDAEGHAGFAGGEWPPALGYGLPDGTGDEAEVQAVDGVWLRSVWDLIAHLPTLLTSDIPPLAIHLQAERILDDPRIAVLGDAGVWAEPSAIIEPFSAFDTTAGPVLICRGARVQAFTRVVGPCFIGPESIVTTDRIAASSIGASCRVHGELSMSILIGHVNKAHEGFVGHSVLGRWTNLGAGTTTSNLKNTYGPVSLWTPTGFQETGLQFLGTFAGDHVKTGIGLRLSTGCVLGVGANVVEGTPPRAVPPFAWGARAPYTQYRVDRFLDTAARVMLRRGVTLDEAARAWWRAVYAHAVSDAASAGNG